MGAYSLQSIMEEVRAENEPGRSITSRITPHGLPNLLSCTPWTTCQEWHCQCRLDPLTSITNQESVPQSRHADWPHRVTYSKSVEIFSQLEFPLHRWLWLMLSWQKLTSTVISIQMYLTELVFCLSPLVMGTFHFKKFSVQIVKLRLHGCIPLLSPWLCPVPLLCSLAVDCVTFLTYFFNCVSIHAHYKS